jgi:hypothetical protein
MWRKFNQWPTSCVAVLPRWYGVEVPGELGPPTEPVSNTTPSVAEAPPGNWAYPSTPPLRLQTQTFRYWFVGQASLPPCAVYFTELLVEKAVTVVDFLIIPVVAAPVGLTVARQN